LRWPRTPRAPMRSATPLRGSPRPR
jgi:hypothetical protein